uniref:Uncharacterized protein n=1 Tax=Magallana gigas TaxID=29159 RepID=K1Q6U3_MAGGI
MLRSPGLQQPTKKLTPLLPITCIQPICIQTFEDITKAEQPKAAVSVRRSLTTSFTEILHGEVETPEVVAIGECGLDYFHWQTTRLRVLQKEVFDKQATLAHNAEHGIPGKYRVEGQWCTPEVVAIGECGLDYFHWQTTRLRVLQKEIFDKKATLAHNAGMPLVIHCRYAERGAFQIARKCLSSNK